MFEEEKIYEDLSLVVRRAGTVFRILFIVVFLVLAFYWKTQILEFKKYWQMSENNRTRTRTIAAPRGPVKDRNGIILAENRATFKILLFRENVKDMARSVDSISSLIGIGVDELKARIAKYKNVPLYEPVVIRDGLTLTEAAPIESRRREFPELMVEAEPQRYYPMGTLAAHVLGYLQERTEDDFLTDDEHRFRVGDLGGRSGLERMYDRALTGRSGAVVEVVDSLGRSRGELARTAPSSGGAIILTLDAKLQAKAEELLIDREGAIVALDTRTGGVLAMANSPTFDPNKFITRFTPAEWQAVASNPDNPMENRAIRGLYAPGSIFKLVMALGGLAGGFIDDETAVYCNGSTVIYGIPFKCWFEPGHGLMRLPDAIKNSCNIYFYELGRRMGIDNIAAAARRLGLGTSTGIDIPGEKQGLVPDSNWKKTVLKEPWYAGETISVAIGQGQLQVTPLQLASLVSTIANRGVRIRPHLVMVGPDGRTSEDRTTVEGITAVEFEKVIEGMWRSVNDGGTGAEGRVPGFDICGKTGSTQTLSREAIKRLAAEGRKVKTHSWFCGFGPRNNPQIAVAVLVEFGGGGGATAGPVAHDIFNLFFNGEAPKK